MAKRSVFIHPADAYLGLRLGPAFLVGDGASSCRGRGAWEAAQTSLLMVLVLCPWRKVHSMHRPHPVLHATTPHDPHAGTRVRGARGVPWGHAAQLPVCVLQGGVHRGATHACTCKPRALCGMRWSALPRMGGRPSH